MHLVGSSYGALLCLLFAMREPSLVRSMVLAEPPAITQFVGFPPRPPEILKLLVNRPRIAIAIIKLGARGLAPATNAFERNDAEAGLPAFGDAVLGPGGYGRLPEFRKAQFRDNASNVRAQVLRPDFPPMDPADVQKVGAPVLLVNGARSIPLFQLLTDRLHELLPLSERVQIPGTTHRMYEEDPAVFNEAALSFLGRAAAAR